MSDKYITPQGKKHLLELGFLGNGNANNFNYLALGVQGSDGASKGKFIEANGDGYQRAQLVKDSTVDDTEQSLSVSATFNSTNFAPSDGVRIDEIAIFNQDISSNLDIPFAYMKVPNIEKKTNVSLKYTIVISIE